MSGNNLHVTAGEPARDLGRLLTVARILCSVLVIAVPMSMLVVHDLWINIVLLAQFDSSVVLWR